jgi:3-methyladenine DNA glycosylase AlkD
MQAYMKSALPFRGVTQPVHRETAKAVFLAHPLRGFEQWRDTILALWRGARFREERYAAIALAADKAYRVHALSVDALPVYDELIAEGAWWDYVDWTAIRLVGPLLREHPRELKPVVRRWSSDANLWRRRASIICQIGAKGETDFRLLDACIRANTGDREFFVRKAIGWALREHSKTDGELVRRYVAEHEDELSPLSRREAMKWLEHVHVPRKKP